MVEVNRVKKEEIVENLESIWKNNAFLKKTKK